VQFDYECALTGLTKEGTEFFDDDLADMPAGWTKVTIQKREYNPKWLMIQQVKQMAIQGMLQQLPPEMQREQGWALSLQVEAQFHSMEKETPMFLVDEEVAFISDDKEVNEVMLGLRDTLGLPIKEDTDEAEAAEAPEGEDSEEEED